jgi:4-hydroxy-4-methyl-2-oxoglutarate aldolase
VDAPLPGLLADLERMGTATVHEAAGRAPVADPAIRPLWPGATLAGPAFTARCDPGDNLAIHRALASASPGEVLVIEAGGHVAGYFGELMTAAARARGIAGLVIDGGVRDAAAIRAAGFPVWCRGVSVLGCQKRTPGQVGFTVACGGVLVHPGDLVIADDDGVVFLRPAMAEAVRGAGDERLARESGYLARLERGETTMQVLGLSQGTTRSPERSGGRT